MKKSIELNELYLQICDALSCGDDSFFEHCFSRKDGVIAIGTDPKEWWPGYNTIIRVFKTQLKEASGFKILPDTPQAYCEGSIGWLAGRPTIKLPDGTEIQIRLTAVFQKEIMNGKSSSGIFRLEPPMRI